MSKISFECYLTDDNDWKKLKQLNTDIEDYLRCRGYDGPYNGKLTENGEFLEVNLTSDSIFKNVNDVTNELEHAFWHFHLREYR